MSCLICKSRSSSIQVNLPYVDNPQRYHCRSISVCKSCLSRLSDYFDTVLEVSDFFVPLTCDTLKDSYLLNGSFQDTLNYAALSSALWAYSKSNISSIPINHLDLKRFLMFQLTSDWTETLIRSMCDRHPINIRGESLSWVDVSFDFLVDRFWTLMNYQVRDTARVELVEYSYIDREGLYSYTIVNNKYTIYITTATEDEIKSDSWYTYESQNVDRRSGSRLDETICCFTLPLQEVFSFLKLWRDEYFDRDGVFNNTFDTFLWKGKKHRRYSEVCLFGSIGKQKITSGGGYGYRRS